ncbi:diguanylate cyclase [Niveibacterium terrae]|uniref:sensor domain-containing diguanylate cyclase n=1 Tax=Niveibacterium terrae TaxID=3373598 RepID=UPI003A953250
MSRLCRSLLILLLLCPLIAGATGLAFRIERLPDGVAAQESEVLSGKLDSSFVPTTVAALNDLSSPRWFRLLPEADWRESSPPVLQVRQSRFQQLTVYPLDGSPPTTLSALGRNFPASQTRGILIFPLGATLSSAQSIYLRARLDGPPTRLKPIVTLNSRDAAQAATLAHVRLSSGAFAALMALALCALCVWLIAREPLFLIYSGLVASQGIYVCLAFYEGYSLPGIENLLFLGTRLQNFFASLGALIAVQFARRMTNVRQIAPRLDRALALLQTLFLLLLLAVLLLPFAWRYGLAALGNFAILTGTMLIVFAGALGWWKGSRAAAFFLLAWLTMQGFTFAHSLCDFLGLQPSLAVYYGFPLSMVLSGVMLALGLADRVREMRAALREAQKHANTDALTGVLNRRTILERLDSARKAFRNEGVAVSVLFIDIDHFKRINDTHGHLVGDACLREISRRLLARLRHSDAVGRYGGEEFLIVLRGVERAAAAALAEEIREAVGVQPLDNIRLSCSIGVASSGSDPLSAEDLIARADAALYAAKNSGRNRVAIAPESSLLSPDPVQTEGGFNAGIHPETANHTPR